MKKNEQIADIYQKFLNNVATRQELDQLFRFLNEGGESELKQLLAEALRNANVGDQMIPDQALVKNVRSRIMQYAGLDATPVIPMRSRSRSVWYYAASVLVLISVAGVLFLSKQGNKPHATDLKAGGNMAMLSTGGSDTIDLNAAKPGKMIQQSAGVSIAKTGDGIITYTAYGTDTAALARINTLITPCGGQYHVRLSDGTEVVLNACSKLEFPVGFTGNQRVVKLTGEAYFKVAKNKEKPFIVATGGQKVQVLGTQFNISDQPEDGGPVTTLTEGSVKVTSHNATAMLKPGQQSHATAAGITVNDVDADLYSAWKDGDFVFENVSLDIIMYKLSRWYNFEIDHSKLPQKNLYMRISRQVNLSEVLSMITTTSGVKFKIDERRVTVM